MAGSFQRAIQFSLFPFTKTLESFSSTSSHALAALGKPELFLEDYWPRFSGGGEILCSSELSESCVACHLWDALIQNFSHCFHI